MKPRHRQGAPRSLTPLTGENITMRATAKFHGQVIAIVLTREPTSGYPGQSRRQEDRM